MPLVRIDVAHGLGNRLTAIGDAVHDAMVEAIGIPADDRFQVQTELPEGRLVADPQYSGIERGSDQVIVDITLRVGRPDDAKRALYAAIVRNASERAGIAPSDVVVVLSENGLADWSFGDGIAQYAPGS